MRLVGRAHVLDLLDLLARRGRLRFSGLRREMRVGANVLSLRLQDLVDADLVARFESAGVAPRVEYELTPRGSELVVALEPLRAWSARHPRASAASARVPAVI